MREPHANKPAHHRSLGGIRSCVLTGLAGLAGLTGCDDGTANNVPPAVAKGDGANDGAANPDAAKAETAKAETTKAAEPKAAGPASGAAGPLIDHQVMTLDGKSETLAAYRGKALLIVNTASQCGYTPQYAGLQELYGRYKDKGLVVLGFPSNDFGEQEPGTAEEIREFVDSKFAVDFPMYEKLHTKGPEQAPLYTTLTTQTPDGIAGEIEWNFTKFLVDPDGRVVGRFGPKTKPMADDLVAAVEAALPSGS